jgi:hypothetical protein
MLESENAIAIVCAGPNVITSKDISLNILAVKNLSVKYRSCGTRRQWAQPIISRNDLHQPLLEPQEEAQHVGCSWGALRPCLPDMMSFGIF